MSIRSRIVLQQTEVKFDVNLDLNVCERPSKWKGKKESQRSLESLKLLEPIQHKQTHRQRGRLLKTIISKLN